MLTKIARENLLKLCAYMESLPPGAANHFNMRSFIRHDGDGHEHKVPPHPSVADLLTCGTSACALGWAATIPEFQKLGILTDEYGGVINEHCVFPDLSDSKWCALFEGHNRDKTPVEWAKRARALIEQWHSFG